MARETRLANKTIWAAEDMQAVLGDARKHWTKAMQQAERNIDPAMMLALAKLRDALADIERLNRDIRHGEYSGGRG